MTVLAVLGVLGLIVTIIVSVVRVLVGGPKLLAIRTLALGFSLLCMGLFVLLWKGDGISWLALALGGGLFAWGVVQVRALRRQTTHAK